MPIDVGRSAGDYSNLGHIQQNQPTSVSGDLVDNWVTIGDDWFEVIPSASRDARHFAQLKPTISHLVHCRYNSQTSLIRPLQYRLLLQKGTQVLYIDAAMDVRSRHIEIELHCIEVQLPVES